VLFNSILNIRGPTIDDLLAELKQLKSQVETDGEQVENIYAYLHQNFSMDNIR
jgi:hypothetical protein